jgi:hypothetical protein
LFAAHWVRRSLLPTAVTDFNAALPCPRASPTHSFCLAPTSSAVSAMSLSSGFSDIHWDRINARVEHLLEVISSSPTLHKRINSADFVDMGAHFYVFPQNSWPKQIDTVHDNTTCTQAYHEANMTKDSKTPSLPTLPGHGTGSGALPPHANTHSNATRSIFARRRVHRVDDQQAER